MELGSLRLLFNQYFLFLNFIFLFLFFIFCVLVLLHTSVSSLFMFNIGYSLQIFLID